MEGRAGQADRAALAEVRAAQQRVRLEDDAAAEAVKEAARAAAEGMLDRGLECLKRRTRMRDYSDALQVALPGMPWAVLSVCLCGAACPPPGFVKGHGRSMMLRNTQRLPGAALEGAKRDAPGPVVLRPEPGASQPCLGCTTFAMRVILKQGSCAALTRPALCGQAVSEVLGYSRALASLAGDKELPPGLGPVSVYGGRLDADGKRRELRDLYRRANCL